MIIMCLPCDLLVAGGEQDSSPPQDFGPRVERRSRSQDKLIILILLLLLLLLLLIIIIIIIIIMSVKA